jgi:Predicted integral membrane protein
MTITILAFCQNSDKRLSLVTKQYIKTNDMTYPVKNISITINKPSNEVYKFASNPENLPKWVDFVRSMTKENDIWFADTDLGKIKIEFVPQNDFGIIDHLVTLSNGETVNNPLRVIKNGKESELIFTLFWMPNRTQEEFNQDAKAVESDLQTLKKILESE